MNNCSFIGLCNLGSRHFSSIPSQFLSPIQKEYMKKCWLCLVAQLFCFVCLRAQYYFYDANHLEPEWRWETGMNLGWMNCLTDLGGGPGNGKKFIKDINWKNGKLCGGVFVSITHH